LYNVKRFALHIVQPRLNHFVEWWITLDELLTWYEQQAKPAAAATRNPNAEFKAGTWCSDNFCKLRRNCKVRAEAMAKAALDNFEGFDNLDELDKLKPKEVATLTGAQLAKAYDLSKQVAKWISDLKDHVYAELKQGHDVGGKKLVAGKNARVFAVDEADVVAAIENTVAAGRAVIQELYTKPELKSVAQIEAIVGKDWFAPAKQAGQRSPAKPEGSLYKLVKKVPGAPAIADKDDPRPAVTLNPEEEFENLDANEEFLN